MKRPALLLLLACALPALAACGSEYPDTISRERFVAVNVALRRLAAPGRDSLRTPADSARARAAVLKRHGVTEADLRAWVDTRRNDTEELSGTWGEIAARLARADSAARADSVRRDSLARRDSIRRDSVRSDSVRSDSVRGGPPAGTCSPARRDTVRRPPAADVPPPPPGSLPAPRRRPPPGSKP